jgi:signal transduction histidine kinase
MGIVVLLVLVFFGAILFINYQYISRSLDAILNRAFSATIRLRQDISYPNEERRVYRNVQPLPRDKAENHFLPIFTVQLDENKNIKRVISAFPLEEAFYSKVTSLALGNSEDGGTIMHDGLLLKYRADKDRIVFLDITKERDMFLNTVHTFLWIAVPLLLVIYLISRYFANRSIKPIEESYNKQREFIADASHELRTPIAAISTNLDILMDLSDENQKNGSLTSNRKPKEWQALPPAFCILQDWTFKRTVLILNVLI